jgi:hypothetical protein
LPGIDRDRGLGLTIIDLDDRQAALAFDELEFSGNAVLDVELGDRHGDPWG